MNEENNMEDEDFGFTKRDNRALVKILTVEKEEGHTQKERGPSSAPTRAAAAGGSGGDSNRGRSKTAPSSVPNNAPNIPNVVEYHLKVKPPSKLNKLEEQPVSKFKRKINTNNELLII